eukprot:1013462-Pyramimonas_sp.AAC.1
MNRIRCWALCPFFPPCPLRSCRISARSPCARLQGPGAASPSDSGSRSAPPRRTAGPARVQHRRAQQ